MTFTEVEVARVPSCPVCGDHPTDHRAGRSAMPDDPVLARLLAQFEGVADGLRRVLRRRRLEPRAGRRRARARRATRGRRHGHVADVPGRGARGVPGAGREPGRRARGGRDARVRRRALRGQLARALLLLQGRAAGRARRASPRRTAARRWWTGPTPTTSATTVPACAPPRSAACCSRCWRPGSARPRSGGWRASWACPPGTRRSRPVWPRACPTVRPSRRTSWRRWRRPRRRCASSASASAARATTATWRASRWSATSSARALELRDEISRRVHAAGFTYVALDLDGFRTGSMNEA